MLTRLKEIFDQIEIYDPNQNIGFRSLKNIGIWLCVYALTDPADQNKIICELVEDIGEKDQFDEVKQLVDELSSPASLKQIIRDYELSNGADIKIIDQEKQEKDLKLLNDIESGFAQQRNADNSAELDELLMTLRKMLLPIPEDKNTGFNLVVNSNENKEKITKKAINFGMNFIIPHLKIDETQRAEMLFHMQNQIKYVWASNNYTTEAVLNGTTGFFNQQPLPYLEANSSQHRVNFNLIEYHDCLFYVAKLNTLQNNPEHGERVNRSVNTAVYLIEPVNQCDVVHLQTNYLAIIDLMEKDYRHNHRRTYQRVADYQQKFPNITVDVLKIDKYSHGTSIVNGTLPKFDTLTKHVDFNFILKFPRLSAPLKTEEHRLGVYRYFQNKHIADIPFDDVLYQGQRQLSYDEVGGEIKNLEAARFILESGACRSDTAILIKYTITNQFMFVYESQNKSDYYAYMIANPNGDLTNIFHANQSYLTRNDIERSNQFDNERIYNSPFTLWRHSDPEHCSVEKRAQQLKF